MGCPTNLNKRTNYISKSAVTIAEGDNITEGKKLNVLPTLVGKPERITALNTEIKKDEVLAGIGVDSDNVNTSFRDLLIEIVNGIAAPAGTTILSGSTANIVLTPNDGFTLSTSGITITNASMSTYSVSTVTGAITATIRSFTGDVLVEAECEEEE